jgi:hypothetical protein
MIEINYLRPINTHHPFPFKSIPSLQVLVYAGKGSRQIRSVSFKRIGSNGCVIFLDLVKPLLSLIPLHLLHLRIIINIEIVNTIFRTMSILTLAVLCIDIAFSI